MSSKTGANAEPRQHSLAVRLTLWYASSAFVLVLLTVGFLHWALVTTLEHEDEQQLIDKARMVAAFIHDAPDDLRELRSEIDRESGTGPFPQLFLRVLDENGNSVAATRRMDDCLPANRFAHAVSLSDADCHSVEIHSTNAREYRALAVEAPGQPVRVIHVAMDRTSDEDLLFRFRCYAIVLSLASLIICGIVGYGLARRGLRPIHEITQAAQRVHSSTLYERLDTAMLPTELAELSKTFNAMLTRLEESFHRLEQFSADIAHELRAPVNNLRGETEVALSRPRSNDEYRETLSSGLEECSRLSALIDNLLFLARAESPQMIVSRQTLDIGHEVNMIRDYFAPAAHESGIDFNVEVPEGISAELDRSMFQRALSNLINNALVHTPRGGKITLRALLKPDFLGIEVTDTGSGISPEHLPHVFDRLYRADAARTSESRSIGIGLAIVRSVVTLHGGTCGIESQINQGTTVWIKFPINRPA
jgi:two-component system heavy metal sensor histidine kinase CusS